MKTPIYDFVQKYIEKETIRFHMPGHKGKSFLGMEHLDLTEVKGADSLYEADGIIKESEENASNLFGTQRTFYSTEGSSQCIKAMIYLALSLKEGNTILAARNVHKAFVYGAALCDAKVKWMQDQSSTSLCSCTITSEQLERELQTCKPCAVYITSPDYLGNVADIKALAEVCHKYDTLLMVDNAHGAYLNFLEESRHPIALGADLCCDSAHKTLPVLTGGAYLHINQKVQVNEELGKHALSLFGSTSPSYLILESLDLCNKYLAEDFREELKKTTTYLNEIKRQLKDNGWNVQDSDPLRITIKAPKNTIGIDLANVLRKNNIECEYADQDYVVLMLTSQNNLDDLQTLLIVLGENKKEDKEEVQLPFLPIESEVSIREAVFSRSEFIPIEQALGRICASPTVSCPPAIPIVVSGERISKESIEIMKYYGIDKICVIKEVQ